MIAIRAEIAAIERGRIAVAESALRHAPHTLRDILRGDWDRRYDRAQGCTPAGGGADKYWPPVNRVDNSYGDRNLVCSCPPTESYADAAE